MKYILTDQSDAIIAISDTLSYQENGNLVINNGTLAIPPFMVKEKYSYEGEIPNNIVPYKYKYIENEGFIRNENYIENYPIEERLTSIEEVINMLLLKQ